MVIQSIIYISIGLLIGFVADKTLSKRQNIKLIHTILPSVIGSIAGGYLTIDLNFTSTHDKFFISIIVSTICSIMGVGIGYVIKKRS